MATIDNNKYSLAHVMGAATSDGAMIELADVISQQNELIPRIPFFPSNMPFENKSRRNVTQFEPSARVANEGAVVGVNEHEQVTDTLIRFETEIAVDELALKGINDPSMWFTEQVEETAMGFGKKVADQFIDGDFAADPGKEFNGLRLRSNSLPTVATDTSDRFYNVIAGGGSGADNTSIYLVGLGKRGVHGIYFKNGQAGLQINRKGRQRVLDASGNPYWAETAQMLWDCGLVATQHRKYGRICNIDNSALTLDAASGANISQLMIQLVNHVVMDPSLQYVWLANNKIKTYFHTQRDAKSNVQIGWEEDNGIKSPTFAGFPILRMDTIGIADALVS